MRVCQMHSSFGHEFVLPESLLLQRELNIERWSSLGTTGDVSVFLMDRFFMFLLP